MAGAALHMSGLLYRAPLEGAVVGVAVWRVGATAGSVRELVLVVVLFFSATVSRPYIHN